MNAASAVTSSFASGDSYTGAMAVVIIFILVMATMACWASWKHRRARKRRADARKKR